MITTIKIREGNALFHETGLFSTLSITGKVKLEHFLQYIYRWWDV